MDTKIPNPVSRWRFSFGWALPHLLVSMTVAVLSALLVFGVWYPEPWRAMLGVSGIFGLVIAVDMVSGPLLTLVLAVPKKTRCELWLDLSLVAFIQLGALGYGMWSVFSARPVALVFEVDRFVVVTANEVLIEHLKNAPPGFQYLPKMGVHLLTVRQAQSQDERLRSVELSLQGITLAMRPTFWRPYEEAQNGLCKAAKPLTELIDKRPAQRDLIVKAAATTGLPNADLQYVPLTSSKDLGWVILLSGTGEIVGYVPVDGFDG